MHELCTDFKKIYDVVRSVILLGTSAKLRKASIIFVITVCIIFKQRHARCVC